MKKQSVIVLGAGMVGTCTALHLTLRGHDVTLVDRGDPGRETSYGNAGLIQREAVEPPPFPRDFATVLRVALKRGADVHYHFGALPGLATRLAGYWLNSGPRHYTRISRAYGQLIAGCIDEHQALMKLCRADDLVRKEGYYWVYRTPATFEEGVLRARRLERDYGVRHTVLDSAAFAQAEPALRQRVPGGIHWLDPWSINDPGELVKRYFDLFLKQGGRAVTGDAQSLKPTSTGWHVRTAEGGVDAAQAVIALGPWSSVLTERLGYRYPLFVKRGYHLHYRGGQAPRRPVLDADGGFVVAPMARGVRLTTGAEFARVDAPATPVQVGRATALARQLFDLPEPVEDKPWLGARPCTADMLPVIGPAPKHPGLWFNFGHAHQGFTLGPMTGRLLADLVDGAATTVDPSPYSASRFS